MPEFIISFKSHCAKVILAFALVIMAAYPDALRSQEMSCVLEPPYEAPAYKAPLAENRESKPSLKDNGDGTLTDSRSKLMWAQKDSYADLNKCLTYTESLKYVEKLNTGGNDDWRIPTTNELASIYDNTRENVMAWDHDPEYPLALDSKFADGAAYWYWSSDCGTTELTECCAKTFYFVTGIIEMRRFELCNNGGVRAVRNIP